jgi:aspartyl-tRNA(Asn)/glutamyl-tRNA(Gln) amidotransferase subunit B
VLTDYDIGVLTADAALGDFFEQVARQSGDAKAAANWTLGEVLATLKTSGQAIAHFTVRPADLAGLIDMVRAGTVSGTAAKRVFALMAQFGDRPRDIADREGLLKISDDATLGRWIDEVLGEHPAEAARFLTGERRLQGVLVGHVMKKSNASADPQRVNQLLAARPGT